MATKMNLDAMSNEKARPAWIAAHPVYFFLRSFSIVCFVGTFITDVVYWRSMSFMWETFSIWLLTVGLVTAVIAILTRTLIFFAGERVRKMDWGHGISEAFVLAISLINTFVHSRDGYTAVVPTGIILSAAVVAIMLGSFFLDRRREMVAYWSD